MTSVHDGGSRPFQVGEVGVLQNLSRADLNGQIAEVTGALKRRMLYSVDNPRASEIAVAYQVSVPGYPTFHERVRWCVKAHQIRRISDPDERKEQPVVAGTDISGYDREDRLDTALTFSAE